MNKKRLVSTVLIVVFVLITLMNFFVIYYEIQNAPFVTGSAIDEGGVHLEVRTPIDFVIQRPIDKWNYTFDANDRISPVGIPEFYLPLNITTTSNIVNWTYTLFNHDYGYYDLNVVFSPNDTMQVRIGWNNLSVTAYDEHGGNRTETADFLISVGNSAPEILMDDHQVLYACEGRLYEHYFEVYELDGDALTRDYYFNSPPFYCDEGLEYAYSAIKARGRFYSFLLDKPDVGNHTRRLFVNDNIYQDDVNLTFVVLEVNRIPVLSDLRSEMIWTQGQNNRTFYTIWNATDVEDGPLSAQNLNFTFKYQNGSDFELFEIDNLTGEINFTAMNDTPRMTHNLSICVTDNPLSNLQIHPLLNSTCGVNGTSNTICDNFSLTITDLNRAPFIIETTPNETILELNATLFQNFTINVTDVDYNPIDIEWYVDGVLEKVTTFSWESDFQYQDYFYHSFSCDDVGTRSVVVNVTDGALHNSSAWTVYVMRGNCPAGNPGGGGGGGGGGGEEPECFEKWSCGVWDPCVSIHNLFALGELSIYDFNSYVDMCAQLGINETICGFQNKECIDLNYCNNTEPFTPKPEEDLQVCHYVLDPGCFDEIKNCHSGGCEVLVDCGGPCGACPSCRDGIQNQGEEGIDCGGPCNVFCEYEEPYKINYFVVILLFLILILVIFIIYFVYRIYIIAAGKRRRDEDEKDGVVRKGSSRRRRIQEILDKKYKGDNLS